MPPKKDAKKRMGEMVNPEVVKTFKNWTDRYYLGKGNYKNLVIDYKTGNPVLLNDQNLSEQVRVFEVPRAVLLTSALDTYRHAKGLDREKYTLALQALKQLNEDEADANLTEAEAMQVAQYELAQAVSAYRVTPTPEGAKQVARAQKVMYTREKEALKRASSGMPVQRIFKELVPVDVSTVPGYDEENPPMVYCRYNRLIEKREINFTEALEAAAKQKAEAPASGGGSGGGEEAEPEPLTREQIDIATAEGTL
jgi:hypothetical protein